jgi:lipopolysaccharide/colanic/teichoic acid biosynthesis glycosyltransferase
MSLVGPRPCLPFEWERLQEWQRERYNAAPGLTGYWQVNGKNRTTFAEMIEMDIWYTKNLSLFVDLGIILRTPFAILSEVLRRKEPAPADFESNVIVLEDPVSEEEASA